MSVVVRARSLHAAGVELTANFLIPSVSTWTKISTVTARASEPDTAVSSGSIIVDGNGQGTFTFRGSFSLNSGTQQFKVQKNGVDVGSAVNKDTVGTLPGIVVAPGDVIDFLAFATINTTATRTVVGDPARTYLYFTPD